MLRLSDYFSDMQLRYHPEETIKYPPRVTKKIAQEFLTWNGNGRVFLVGHIWTFKVKSVGAGIYEVWLELGK